MSEMKEVRALLAIPKCLKQSRHQTLRKPQLMPMPSGFPTLRHFRRGETAGSLWASPRARSTPGARYEQMTIARRDEPGIEAWLAEELRQRLWKTTVCCPSMSRPNSGAWSTCAFQAFDARTRAPLPPRRAAVLICSMTPPIGPGRPQAAPAKPPIAAASETGS